MVILTAVGSHSARQDSVAVPWYLASIYITPSCSLFIVVWGVSVNTANGVIDCGEDLKTKLTVSGMCCRWEAGKNLAGTVNVSMLLCWEENNNLP